MEKNLNLIVKITHEIWFFIYNNCNNINILFNP